LDRARDRAAAAPMRRELALALARAGQLEEAREVLSGLLTTVPPDAETLGLVGRINKDLAWRSSDAEEGRAHLQSALAFYLDGYRRDGDAYCGINAASLHALLGEQAAAAGLAAEVLDGLDTQDAFWQSAIRGEAALLLGRVEEARQHYAVCAASGTGRIADLQSVWIQGRRLCAALHGGPSLIDECFAGQSSEPEPLAERLQSLRRILEEPVAHNGDSPDGAETAALRPLAHELLRLQEEQRHTLSRELHDNIAQLLTATTNRIAMARSEATSKKLRRELTEAREAVEQALQAVSDLSRNLRPAMIDQIGLAAAIEKHAAAFRDRVKLELHVHIEAPSAETLDGAAATNLFRIVQEALNNIEKHARATEAHIRLLEEEKLLRLEIADNGRSFTPDHAATAQKNGSLGLISMRERAEMLGGTFEIDAQHGNGTRVRAHVPLRN
jgi:signal transduction histidine kinase